MDANKSDKEPVYVISVAARLADVHPQTLRIYERKGLISPARVHNRRRFSEADIERCRLIQEMTQQMGVNLAGVKMILDMRKRMEGMRERVASLEEELQAMKGEVEERVREIEQSFRNDIVPLPRGDLMSMQFNDPFKKLRGKGSKGK
jgi:MerR family transcriptional regulator/heat shock protein HspR